MTMSKPAPIIIAIALAVLVLWPLRASGSWFPMHDTTHIARLYLMEETIKGGQFPPIWASEVNNEYGYPLFHFYAPVFYYLALILKLIFGSYLTGIKLSLLVFIFSGIYGVMKLASRWGRGAMIVSGAAFALSPYLALDLYVRGAFAEIAGMMLFPWVLLAWEKLETKKQLVFSGVATALFLGSHNLIPIIAFPILAAWVILTHRKNLKKIILPSILTLLLAAGYLLPLLFERSFVKADQIARVTDYSLHFVYPSQIWNSTWGYGGSGAGIEDGLSFKMGKLQLLLSLLGLAALIKSRKRKLLFFPAAAASSLFMATTWARPIWDSLPFLAVIQFPWRYLSLAGTLLAISAGASLLLLRSRLLRLVLVGIVVSALLYFNYKYFSPQWTFFDPESRYYQKEYLATIKNIIPEFMPRWMPETPAAPPANSTERAYYPTWKVSVDGKKVPTSPTAEGLLAFPNPQNSSDIKLTQSHTPLEYFGYTLSLVGVVYSLSLLRRR